MRSGSLVRLLPGWSLPEAGMYAVYPPGRHMPATVCGFVEFYRQYLLEAEDAAGRVSAGG